MPRLTEKEFASLLALLPDADEEQLLNAAKQAETVGLEAFIRQVLDDDFGIVSAHNPGRKLTPADNRERHLMLEDDLRFRGYQALPQRGVFGGAEEASLLAPGMPAQEVAQIGREFGQEAVISGEGYHRLSDGAVTPAEGVVFDTALDDNFSEVADPARGTKVRYQLQFPETAFTSPGSAFKPKLSPPDAKLIRALKQHYARPQN